MAKSRKAQRLAVTSAAADCLWRLRRKFHCQLAHRHNSNDACGHSMSAAYEHLVAPILRAPNLTMCDKVAPVMQ